MRGNSFGEVFVVTSAGESHGPAITTIVDGTPSGLEITPELIQVDLDRRRPGQGVGTSPRQEPDKIQITAGIYEGKSTGTPICLVVPNVDQRSQDYEAISELYRPSHADAVYDLKYGFRDPRGGGRSSFRVLVGAVAAGAIARQIIKPVTVTAYVDQVGDIRADVDGTPTLEEVERSPIRCPDLEASARMQELIKEVDEDGDSIGGVIKFVIEGALAGLGEPIFDKLSSRLAKDLSNINATTAFELGAGFAAATMRGSQYNDPILAIRAGRIITATNNAGGINGGISNGMPIYGRVPFHPPTSIEKEQDTVDRAGRPAKIVVKGRHDAFVVSRAVPAIEAMLANALADFTLLRQLGRLTLDF